MFRTYRGKGRYFLLPLASAALTVLSFFWSASHPALTPIPWYNSSPWWDWGFSLLTVGLLFVTAASLGVVLLLLRPDPEPPAPETSG